MTTQPCQKCGEVPATQGVGPLMVCDSCAEVLRRTYEWFQNVTSIPNRQEIIESIVAEDSRFSAEVYEFTAEAMERALSEWVPKQDTGMQKAFEEWFSKHGIDEFSFETQKAKEMPVGGLTDMKIPSEQLVVALRRLASERFGKCATATFNSWGITRWQDFAEVVSRMQEADISLFPILAFNRDDFKSRGVLDDVFPET